MNDKQAAIEALPTEQIEMIVASVDSGPEHLKAPSKEYPLAGMVRVKGVGNVEVRDLQRELARRQSA